MDDGAAGVEGAMEDVEEEAEVVAVVVVVLGRRVLRSCENRGRGRAIGLERRRTAQGVDRAPLTGRAMTGERTWTTSSTQWARCR